MSWYPAETNMCNFVTQQTEEVHDMANKGVLSVFTLNSLQAGHWVREDNYIMVNWTHVLVIVLCQGDGCSLSSKDGAVVWQSFGQLVAGCLAVLEVAIDDCCCLYSLIHFRAISIDFIVWSLMSFTILVELSLGLLSGDHTFAQFN